MGSAKNINEGFVPPPTKVPSILDPLDDNHHIRLDNFDASLLFIGEMLALKNT